MSALHKRCYERSCVHLHDCLNALVQIQTTPSILRYTNARRGGLNNSCMHLGIIQYCMVPCYKLYYLCASICGRHMNKIICRLQMGKTRITIVMDVMDVNNQ